MPLAKISFSWGENDRRLALDMKQFMRHAVKAAGGWVVDEEPTLAAPGEKAFHELGTAPFGTDPLTSVLDPFNACWEVPNTFVVDGAAWPSSGWQPPTLTMLALCGRASHHLVGNLKQNNWRAPK
jgi:choline dehydrogenase-like flavoprotein